MENWFGSIINDRFTLFSTSHTLMIILYFIVLMVLFFHYKKVTASSRFSNILRWTLAVFLLLSETTYQIWMAVNDIWRLEYSMPLHICSLAGMLAIIALTTRNKHIIIFTYFLGFLPAGLTIITPELAFDYPHYRYWQFFLHHIVLSCSSFYLVLTSRVNITLKTALTAFGVLLFYALVVGAFINPVLGGNYLFLSASPANDTIINFLGSGIFYIVNLVIVGFFVFLLSFGVFKLAARR